MWHPYKPSRTNRSSLSSRVDKGRSTQSLPCPPLSLSHALSPHQAAVAAPSPLPDPAGGEAAGYPPGDSGALPDVGPFLCYQCPWMFLMPIKIYSMNEMFYGI